MWREHIPKPEPQFEVINAQGNLVGIVDFAWPEFGVFLEFDGAIKYERLRRTGETLEDVILREKRRQEQICLATGWTCIRITWEDLAKPTTTARRIRQILEGRAAYAS
jgi:very-short-patch-repair endonuclease